MTLTRRSVLGAALAAAVAGCGPVEDPATGGGSGPLAVGVIRSTTPEGVRFDQGLRAGLQYATNYTGKIGRRRIALTRLDTAESRGIRLLVSAVTGDAALRLAAAAERDRALLITSAPDDRLTGLNRYTFRCGHQAYQDLAAVRTLVPAGARVAVQGLDRAAAETIGQFAGSPAALPPGMPAVGVLGERSTWASYPPSRAGAVRLATSWADGAFRGGAYHALRIRVPGLRTDTGHQEGFAAAQMVVRALQYAPGDPDGMITALEGARLASVKGELEIRATDHALLQPMFEVALTWTGAAGAVTATTIGTLTPAQTAPPL
ncbi:type 1 periplasmic-binding domain-containing protein [Paractinoplanes durhamensis]|uniref:Leucine-binding protein domain-containing protein n=1 Tax=Paractinoplanes durhamensis TaxID=113563 RepID=A0ABQ3YTY4_9ACTN|nr:hypothetical protein [Actinoplanes durhamensis]GIE00997.1 hypothetical protein Adu01nite_23470 [Actinoplanes durhamensis]